MSANTGVAPSWRTTLASATNVSEGITTSSPGDTPTAFNASSKAAVPFATANAFSTAAAAANARSKAAVRGPIDNQPESRTSSAAARWAGETRRSDSRVRQTTGGPACAGGVTLVTDMLASSPPVAGFTV